MAHHSFQRVIFALLTLFVASTAATIEETEADGLVSPGATGNRVVLSITNPSATLTAENLTLQVESRPRWLEVTEIRTDSEGPLAPGQARRFEVVFDVADDADVDLIGELKVGFSADGVLFDHPARVVKLGIGRSTMSLLSIDFGREPGSDVEWKPGQSGFVERYKTGPAAVDVETFCFVDLPLEITPGEPLRFVLRSEVREAYAEGHHCQNRETADGSHPRSWLSLNGKEVSIEAKADLLSYCDEGLVEEPGVNVKEATDLQTEFEYAVELQPSATDPGIYRAQVHSQDDITKDELSGAEITLGGSTGLTLIGPEQLRVRYGRPDADHPALTEVPRCPTAPELAQPQRGGGPLRYRYGYWAISYSGSGYSVSGGLVSGTVVEKGSGQGWFTKRLLRDPPGAGEQAAAQWREELTTYECQGGRHMIYNHPYYWTSLDVTPDGPYDTRDEVEARAREDDWNWTSTDLTPEELWDTFGCEGDSRKPGDPGIADDPTDGDSPPDTGSDENTIVAPPIPGDTAAFDPADPATMDPDRHPEVADRIRVWLSVAEPPESAVPGVDFNYDEFGRKIGGGGTTGRTISRHDSVDYGSGASPEARVWSELRTELDSIDHCTVEEYVVATIQGGSIDFCRGRYGAVRDLGDVALSEAKSEVQAGGFEVQLAPGSPAPSPELVGAVEEQNPPPTRFLRRGQTLTLKVYAPYVPETTAIPDLVGLSRAEAKQRLEDEGLVVVLRPGTPARSPAESDTIESQEPAAGTALEPGAEVVIRVRPTFVASNTIPELVGLSTGKARTALEAAGIDATLIDLRPGNPAPTAALAGTIEAQEPTAGWIVEPGTRVTLRVHSAFVDLRTVPSVVGLSTGEAKDRLAALGLQVNLVPGDPAGSESAFGTVQSQSPSAGAGISSDASVTLAIHSPYVPPSVATPAPPPPIATPTSGGLPLPNLQCPAFVTLRSNSDLCMAAHMNPPPVGSQVPLDRERSGHANSPSSMQYGKYFFKCYYRIGSGSRDFMTLSWTHGQHQGPVEFMPCANRLEGGQFGGSFSFLSSTHFVQAKVNGNCFDPQENEAVVRRYIRQLEPLARTCSGAAAPAPTATPTPSTSGCSLQGAWYQFGSGTVEFTGNEHELRGTLAHGHTWDWVKTLEYKNGEHIFTVRKSGHCTYEGTMKFRWPTDPPAWFPVQLAVSGDSLEIKFLQEPKTTLYSFKGTYERVSR